MSSGKCLRDELSVSGPAEDASRIMFPGGSGLTLDGCQGIENESSRSLPDDWACLKLGHGIRDKYILSQASRVLTILKMIQVCFKVNISPYGVPASISIRNSGGQRTGVDV